MKQVINGKIYNTETATLIAEASGGGYRGDFHHWEEALYRTPRGNYFIAGSGGPLSSWGEKVSANEWSGGSGIRVLTKKEAQHWAEEHADPDTVIGEFSDIEEA